MSDRLEAEAVQLFFSRGNVGNTMVAMCVNAKAQGDVITHVVTVMLKTPIQIQFTVLGLQPFQGKDLLIPYNFMSVEQREYVLRALREQHVWTVFEKSMTLRRQAQQRSLDPLDVLEGMCDKLLATKAYPDHQTRLVLCNIILQRIRASVPFSCAIQNGLNARLFSRREPDGGDAVPRADE